MRILCLDYGQKRIGVAISDETGIIAQALITIERKSIRKDMKRILQIVHKYDVGEVILGLPKNMDGSLGEKAKEVLAFKEQLENVLSIPIVDWDERLSTAFAERVLLEADLSRSKRKRVIDRASAAVILQGYLDFKKRTHLD